jgi:hypothetical protein
MAGAEWKVWKGKKEEMTDAVETVLDRIEQQQEAMERAIPKDVRALQLLQMEYRGEIELTHNQRRAAIACLQFESPKLGVIATANMSSDDFCAALERAIARSGVGMKLIEHHPSDGKSDEGKPSPPPIPAHGPRRDGLFGSPDKRFRR